MLNLYDDPPASRMNGIRHAAPTYDLLTRVNSGRSRIPMRFGADRGSFRDNERCGRTLRVVFSVQRSRHMAFTGTHSRERRHHDSIRQLNITELQGNKE